MKTKGKKRRKSDFPNLTFNRLQERKFTMKKSTKNILTGIAHNWSGAFAGSIGAATALAGAALMKQKETRKTGTGALLLGAMTTVCALITSMDGAEHMSDGILGIGDDSEDEDEICEPNARIINF